jgi:hypothetical protein
MPLTRTVSGTVAAGSAGSGSGGTTDRVPQPAAQITSDAANALVTLVRMVHPPKCRQLYLSWPLTSHTTRKPMSWYGSFGIARKR